MQRKKEIKIKRQLSPQTLIFEAFISLNFKFKQILLNFFHKKVKIANNLIQDV